MARGRRRGGGRGRGDGFSPGSGADMGAGMLYLATQLGMCSSSRASYEQMEVMKPVIASSDDSDPVGMMRMWDDMNEDDSDSSDSADMEDLGPLHEAAATGRMDTCKYLVEQLGFDINADANDDSGKEGVVRLLLSKGASADISSCEGTPLHALRGVRVETNDPVCSDIKLGSPGATQIFVDVYGFPMSLQPNLNELSVEALINYALERAGVGSTDFYTTFCGKILHPKELLANCAVQKNSTVKVHHRIRGGVRHHTISYKTWDDVVNEEPRFHVVNLSPCLVNTSGNLQSAKFLSEHIQHHAREALITMCRQHKRGLSFCGRFNSSQLLFHDGRAFFSDEVKEENGIPDFFRADYDTMSNIFEGAFRDSANNDFPIYAIHLLQFLWSPDANTKFSSELVIAYVTNHPAIIPFADRMKICTLLDSLLQRLPHKLHRKMVNKLHQIHWIGSLMNVSEMLKVYDYNATYDKHGRILSRTYGYDSVWCVHFSRNFFKHAPLTFNLEEIEASFSLAMSKNSVLPKILQRLAVELDNVPSYLIKGLLQILQNNLIGLKDA